MGKRPLILGILAHVDAGKTTLAEGILYRTGVLRKAGRVDHQTAFLDQNAIERERGITVFSKEARFPLGDFEAVLLDTPGHADFSAEMERTLAALDYAILVISGADGVQSHTATLWNLLKAYEIPVYLFINKMDQPGTDRNKILKDLKKNLGGGLIPMEDTDLEELALCGEEMMETYLETGEIPIPLIRDGIRKRTVFPVCFGSALKMDGIDEFLEILKRYCESPSYPDEFQARVYKISRDRQGQRQTHMKITGGHLESKTRLTGMDVTGRPWEEKADQIRLYSGDRFQPVQAVSAGTVCTVTGLTKTFAGQVVGKEGDRQKPFLEPPLTYQILPPEGCDPTVLLRQLRLLEEEDPLLRLIWKEELQEIHVQVMGELELEVLRRQVKDRFQTEIDFGKGSLVYRETIEATVIGIGHFEPLRHYAEVQLLMEPGAPGSGLVFESRCSEDKLDRNWQRLILSHLAERQHPGVLTGAPITDMKITLVAGRAHLKHTEGGDFRQATYRAVRQGLRKGRSILLEPVCRFRLEIPTENVGRALTDLQRMGASAMPPETESEILTVISGSGPVSELRDYHREVTAYSRGQGRFFTAPSGYAPCHNWQEVVDQSGYDPDQDLENPCGSVFCDHGGAVLVPWDRVDGMAHLDSGIRWQDEERRTDGIYQEKGWKKDAAGEKELEEIFLRTYGKSKRDEELWRQRQLRSSSSGKEDFPVLNWKNESGTPPYLIIDGYNVIFAWEEWKELARANLDSAREAFLEILENYQGYRQIGILVVFDGYRVAGNPGSRTQYGNIQVVYTKEAETADHFIEKTAFELGKKYKITVVTSDRLVQMAAFGDGAGRMSAREFYLEIAGTTEEIRQKLQRQRRNVNRPFEGILGSGKDSGKP